MLKLVELVPSLLTSDETAQRSRDFVEGALGKQAIHCQDRAGFVVNALLIPYRALGHPDARVGVRDGGGHRPRASCSALRPPAWGRWRWPT